MIALEGTQNCEAPARSKENRDSVVSQYRYLIARAARKFERRNLERVDLEQIAAIGLIKAYDRFDAHLQTPFEAFAWLFIVGELMHYVRDFERLVRPPRHLRYLERRAHEASDALLSELGREPSLEEIADRIGVTSRDLHELALYRQQAVAQSIEALEPHHLQLHSYTIEERENRIVFDAALECLTPTEKTIIVALYANGYSQVEVAQRMGYSRRHISRLHRAALKKLKTLWVSHSA
jgi:RNA polymerase sigma factor (sigma-70 family)